MRRVDWTDSAIADLNQIKSYLAEIHPALADRSISNLILAALRLLDNPAAGSPSGYRRWRKWKPRGERHLLIYEPTPDGIRIVRLRHERADWQRLPE